MKWQILLGDVREQLATLPDHSVQCCVTSPPYWGLRDYGTATWDGGDPECGHAPEKRGGRFATPVSSKQAPNAGSGTISARECPCGARRVDNQIGLEPTPAAYVETMVEVFREVRRVLRDDGTLWLNLGDSYAASSSGQTSSRVVSVNTKQATNLGADIFAPHRNGVPVGLKPKDLVGIPWRVAFALQADGWWLRSDIIWSKPNPMPESVTDRPTKAHEYIFLLTKSARYFWDAEAVKEPYAEATVPRRGRAQTSVDRLEGVPGQEPHGLHGLRPYRGKATKDYDGALAQNPSDTKRRVQESIEKGSGANCRSVWEITTQPYPDAHFATFPEALPERCIKAGTKKADTVLDPFCGSGTTGVMAIRSGCDFIGIELNAEYLQLARKRLMGAASLFATETAP